MSTSAAAPLRTQKRRGRKSSAAWADPLQFRENNFDVLRMALAIIVLFGHCYPVTRGNNSYDPLGRLTAGVCDFPYAAVDAFFIISGFLIASSWVHSKSFWSYLKKRLARIYPGFIALWVVMLIVVPWSMHQRPSTDTIAYAPLHILAFQDVYIPGAFPHNPAHGIIDVSLWTISYEFRCYLLLPILAMMAFGSRRWLVAMALLISLVAIAMQPLDWNPDVEPMFATLFGSPMDWARFASCFLAGMVFYCYRDRIPWSVTFALLSAAVLVGSVFYSSIALLIALPTAGAYLLLWIAYTPLGLTHFAKYGDFSYGLYLYAFLIQQLIVQHIPGIGPLSLFIRALPVTLAASIVSWYAVERWFLRNRRSVAAIPLTSS